MNFIFSAPSLKESKKGSSFNQRRQRFNLIEILISMIVIIFAMFIIISFIPLANQQQRQAVNQTHLANFARNFISYLKSQPQNVLYGEDRNLNNNPDPGEDLDGDGQFDSSLSELDGLLQAIRTSRNAANSKRSDFDLSDAADVNGSIKIYKHSTLADSFLIRSVTAINGVDVTEAELEARIYLVGSSFAYSTTDANTGSLNAVNSAHQSGQNRALLNSYEDASEDLSPSDSSGNPIARLPHDTSRGVFNKAVRIMIEFSWPLGKDYEKRDQEFIFLDTQIIDQRTI